MSDKIKVLPEDGYNKDLVSKVHPPDWKNPEPDRVYNLVAIGGGTAGLVSAAGAAGLGGKVALVERKLLGGDCLNFGCVPSKTLIRAARAAAEIDRAREFGIETEGGKRVDFGRVMQRVRRVRSEIADHDSTARFAELGIDIFLGEASFTGPHQIEVGGKKLNFKKAVIATGARPIMPPVPGLAESGALTNETIFELTELPARLAVVGGGPIGCELAQAFRRLGSEVTIIEMGAQFLPREDPDAAAILAEVFKAEGIKVKLSAMLEKVESNGAEKTLHLKVGEAKEIVIVDQILVGAGRAPNVDGLQLEKAGVQYDKFGVKVDDHLRTTNDDVFAVGDIAMQYKFTHAADAAARIAIQNALFWGRKKVSSLTIPWSTYTDPEIAHVGLYEKDAASQGLEVDTFVRNFRDVDRALAEGDTAGFVKIHVKKGTDKIVGATIIAGHAGEMIGEIAVAMAGGVGLKKLSGVIHPYPTQAEAIKQVGDEYNRTRLTPGLKKVFAKLLSWQRA
jgi:pyruvate/2-oxoglutarate dehydrogenase complex dihydrolipoamide dehydrogenase (E3) component